MSKDNGLEFKGEIKAGVPDQLHSIEAYVGGIWFSVTVGEGIKVTAPNKTAADHIITQLRQVHIAKGVSPPLFRARLLSKDETKEVRKHLVRHGQSGKFGTYKNVKPPGLPKKIRNLKDFKPKRNNNG